MAEHCVTFVYPRLDSFQPVSLAITPTSQTNWTRNWHTGRGADRSASEDPTTPNARRSPAASIPTAVEGRATLCLAPELSPARRALRAIRRELSRDATPCLLPHSVARFMRWLLLSCLLTLYCGWAVDLVVLLVPIVALAARLVGCAGRSVALTGAGGLFLSISALAFAMHAARVPQAAFLWMTPSVAIGWHVLTARVSERRPAA